MTLAVHDKLIEMTGRAPVPQRRTLGELSPVEREQIFEVVQAEAQAAGWSRLSNRDKAVLYARWEEAHALTHAALKDSVLKGFDAAQHIPPSGEAAVHTELRRALDASPIPYVRSKVRRPEWRREVDFVLGFSPTFLTHIAELEPATTWQTGLQQALLYKSLYYQANGVQSLPTLIVFGDVTQRVWSQVRTVCEDQRVLLVSYCLLVEGSPADSDLLALLAPAGPQSLDFE